VICEYGSVLLADDSGSPQGGLTRIAVLTLPLRRAEHRSRVRKKSCDCLSAASFTALRTLREAQEKSVLRAFSFGSVFFHVKENERSLKKHVNKNTWSLESLAPRPLEPWFFSNSFGEEPFIFIKTSAFSAPRGEIISMKKEIAFRAFQISCFRDSSCVSEKPAFLLTSKKGSV